MESKYFVSREEKTNVITILGFVPNNEPSHKKNQDMDDPDPISRICLREKKRILREKEITICYLINRALNYDGKNIITISFLASNTGKAFESDPKGFKDIAAHFENTMSLRCYNAIVEYVSRIDV